MRKRWIFSMAIFVLIFRLQGFSQIKKGNFLIGGSLSFNKATRSYDASVSPAISYFFTDRFAAGLLTSLSFSKSTESPYEEISTSEYSIGPTLRYYFPIARKWAVIPQVDYMYGWYFRKAFYPDYPNSDYASRNSGSQFRAGLGGTYFISNNVGLEGILYYQGLGPGTYQTVTFKAGLQVYILKK